MVIEGRPWPKWTHECRNEEPTFSLGCPRRTRQTKPDARAPGSVDHLKEVARRASHWDDFARVVNEAIHACKRLSGGELPLSASTGGHCHSLRLGSWRRETKRFRRRAAGAGGSKARSRLRPPDKPPCNTRPCSSAQIVCESPVRLAPRSKRLNFNPPLRSVFLPLRLERCPSLAGADGVRRCSSGGE